MKRLNSIREASQLALVSLGIASSVGFGYLIASMARLYSVLLVLVVVGGFISVGVHRRLSRPRYAPVIRGVEDDGAFRSPRRLFYLGLLTSCWLVVRVHGVTVSDALFLASLALAGWEIIVKRRRASVILPRGLWVAIGLFVAGAALSTVANSYDMIASAAVIMRVFYLIAAWLWLGATVLRSHAHVWSALKYWVASAAVCGFWAIGQRLVNLPGGIDYGRLAGLTDHVNDLGALSACALVAAIAIAYRDRLWSIAVVGIAAGLLLSGSVGAALAALLALSLGLLAPSLFRPTAIAVAIGLIILLSASPMLGPTPLARLSTVTNSEAQYGEGTLYSRLETFKSAWQRIEAEPILGTGLDQKSALIYNAKLEKAMPVHNLFLGRWYDSGILGLIGILVFVATLWRIGWLQVITSRDKYLALALFAGLIAYIGDDLSEPSLYKRYSLVPALLLIALARITIRERSLANEFKTLSSNDLASVGPVNEAGVSSIFRAKTSLDCEAAGQSS